MKTIIDINGVISAEDNKEITEQQYDELVDLFLNLIESKNYIFGGGFTHCTSKEWMEENQTLLDL